MILHTNNMNPPNKMLCSTINTTDYAVVDRQVRRKKELLERSDFRRKRFLNKTLIITH